MKTTSRLFFLCIFCLALPFLSGCGNRDSLTAKDLAEADKFIAEHGKDAMIRFFRTKWDNENVNMNENRTLNYVKYFVSKEADVNAKDNSGFGFTMLHCVTMGGDVKTVQFLISKGADVNAKGNGGTTPLHFAALHGRVDIVKFLVSQGADVHVKDKEGTTPLDYAKKRNETVIVEYLSDLK